MAVRSRNGTFIALNSACWGWSLCIPSGSLCVYRGFRYWFYPRLQWFFFFPFLNKEAETKNPFCDDKGSDFHSQETRLTALAPYDPDALFFLLFFYNNIYTRSSRPSNYETLRPVPIPVGWSDLFPVAVKRRTRKKKTAPQSARMVFFPFRKINILHSYKTRFSCSIKWITWTRAPA